MPQTTATSPGHVAFLILDGDEHGEHGDHVHPHLIPQRQHGLCTKLPQTWPVHKVASKNNHKTTRLISLVFNSFLWIKALPNLLS